MVYIPVPKSERKYPILITKKRLAKLLKKFTVPEIAKKTKINEKTLRDYIKRYNLKIIKSGIAGRPQNIVKPLSPEKQKIYDLLSQDKLPTAQGKGVSERFKGKKWEELSNTARANFGQQIYPYYKNLLSKTKGMMPENEILKLLSDRFGETVSVASLRGRSGVDSKKFQSRFGQVVKKILKPYDFTKKQKFYKIPTENEINKLKEAYDLRFSQTDTLRPNTVKNISILHDKFKDVFKQGILPDATEVLKKLPAGTTGSQAGNATIRLAQIYAGKKFDLSFKDIDQKFANKINNIKINNPTSRKMFEQISKRKFGDPYLDQFYRINLQMIDEKLGNKTGTFESLKDQAKTILQKNKIPIYDGKAKILLVLTLMKLLVLVEALHPKQQSFLSL